MIHNKEILQVQLDDATLHLEEAYRELKAVVDALPPGDCSPHSVQIKRVESECKELCLQTQFASFLLTRDAV